MNRIKRTLAVWMTLIVMLSFMPAAAMTVNEYVSPETIAAQQKSQNEENAPSSDESVWIKPGQLMAETDGAVYYDADAEKLLKELGFAYPVKVEFTPGEGGIRGEYLRYYIEYDSMNQWNNTFVVTYSDGTSKTFKYLEKNEGGEYYPGYYEVDASGNRTDEQAIFFDYTPAPFTDENDKVLFYIYQAAEIEGQTYFFFKATDNYTVSLSQAEGYANIFGSNGNSWSAYTGKVKKITTDNVWVDPSDYDKGIPQVLSVTPKTDMKSIGAHELEVKIDNSGNYFTDDTLIGYYTICPKKVSNVKATNPKKNTVHVTWKYTDKKNYKQITGYRVTVYNSDYSLYKIVHVKKGKTSVSISNSKLKKNKEYFVEVAAYKTVDGVDFGSEIVSKKIKLKK